MDKSRVAFGILGLVLLSFFVFITYAFFNKKEEVSAVTIASPAIQKQLDDMNLKK